MEMLCRETITYVCEVCFCGIIWELRGFRGRCRDHVDRKVEGMQELPDIRFLSGTSFQMG